MKAVYLLLSILGLICHRANAQQIAHIPAPVPKVIEPLAVKITERYTSTFIFPYHILKYDIGSDEISVMKLSRVENVLLVKSNARGFTPTNVTVFTKDAGIYSFFVSYDSIPSEFTYVFAKDSFQAAKIPGEVRPSTILSQGFSESIIESDFALMAKQRKFIHKKTREGKVNLTLEGLYLKDSLMWMNFKLKNGSLIDYRPDLVRLAIIDKKRFKRTAVQDLSLDTVATNLPVVVRGNSSVQFTFALKPFTISNLKRLKVSLTELDGSRVMNLLLKSRDVLKTRRPI